MDDNKEVEKKETSIKKVAAKPRKATIALKNKKEATKALSKKKAPTAKSKKAVTKSKKDPYKNINIIKKIEPEKKEETKKVVNKPKKTVKKTTTKKEEKTKLVLPKEWTQTKKKPETKTKKKVKEFTNTNTLTNIFKKSLFEEVDEQQYQEEKKIKHEKWKKKLIIIGIVFAVLIIAGVILLKVSTNVKKELALYDPYSIGQKVKLKDDSIWYVIDDSNSHSNVVKLLKETNIDSNNDNQVNDKDKMKYNKDDKAVYDTTLEEGAPYYLDHDYKKILEDKIGKIESIGLMTTKEFIKVRDRMGYSDEWTDGNWLANYKLGNWWLESELNQKVFTVSPKGSFNMVSPKNYNYIRPTIVINKDLIKVEEEKPAEETKIENK